MKKYLIVLLGLLILVTECSIVNTNKESEEKNNSTENKQVTDELFISYRSGDVGSDDDSLVYEIKLYTDKHITLGYSHLDGFVYMTLTDSQYQEIVDLVNSKEFRTLAKDLSDNSVKGGSYSYVTVLYDNGTFFEVGGNNVTNETYLKLEKLLKQFG